MPSRTKPSTHSSHASSKKYKGALFKRARVSKTLAAGDVRPVSELIKRCGAFQPSVRNVMGALMETRALEGSLSKQALQKIDEADRTAGVAEKALKDVGASGPPRAKHIQSLVTALSKATKEIRDLARAQRELACKMEVWSTKFTAHMDVLFGHVVNQARNLPRVRTGSALVPNPFCTKK